MSGGSYDYMYERIEEYYVGNMKDVELNDLMKDLVELLHDLEWADSCDYSEEDYFETVKKFKEKWLKKSQSQRFKKYIDKEIEKTKDKLYKMIGEKL